MPVSLDTLKRLVAEVHEMRSQRQYDEADRKRDKLVRMGVRPPDYGTTFVWRGQLHGWSGGTDLRDLKCLFSLYKAVRMHHEFTVANLVRDSLSRAGITMHEKERAGRAPECPLCRESIERVVKVWD